MTLPDNTWCSNQQPKLIHWLNVPLPNSSVHPYSHEHMYTTNNVQLSIFFTLFQFCHFCGLVENILGVEYLHFQHFLC